MVTSVLPAVRIVADRLYSLTVRVQELAMYGARVTFALRYAPMFDDPAALSERHFRVLVLEITAQLPADAELGRGAGDLQLAKVGWELELATAEPCLVTALPELPEELPLLLERIRETLNDLGHRAGQGDLLGADLVTTLVVRYRSGGSASV